VGECVVVAGPSGSGKSTLLACLAGLDEPDGGEVRIDGARISHQPEPVRAAMRARTVGVLFQSANLLAHLNVAQNIELVQRLAGPPDPVWCRELLDTVGLTSRAHARPTQLSGGETARAGLAVALANRPRVLLADEPTGELDQQTAGAVVDLLRAQADTGSAVIVVSHDRRVQDGADRVVELREGVVAQ